jgi:transcriptional regulator with XRE-family HTH domain
MENKIKEAFWDMLPIKMTAAGVRPVDLARAINVDKSTVTGWMNRRTFPEIDNIQLIASALNCTTDELLGNELPEMDVDFDKMLVASYHAAEPGIQSSVRKLLDIRGKP